MFLNILVGLDGSATSRRALEHAVALARAGNAKLTLVTVAPPVASYVTLAGVSTATMHAELDRWAAGVLARAVDVVPGDVLAHTLQLSGDAGPEIVKELQRGGYDLCARLPRSRTGAGGAARERERLRPLPLPCAASLRPR